MTKKILILALLLGLFTRSYQYLQRFQYAHDNDLASWIVKDIVVDKHPRLIGQLTSSPGIYIGSLWYYLQIPFYLTGNMDPIYVPFLSIIVGLLATVSIYWVVTRIYGKTSSEIASLIYAASWGISGAEREVVPTTPVFLWTIWLLYAINSLLNGNKRGLIIIAILWALIWHINLALIFSIPLVFIVLVFSKNKFKPRDFFLPLVILFILSLPLLIFETRHQFSQTKSLFGVANHSINSGVSLIQKANKVIFYSAKNANSLFWNKPDSVNWYVLPLGILAAGSYLVYKKIIPKSHAATYLAWWLIYLVLFSLNPLNLSEYYLNGFSILWIVILSVFLANLLPQHKRLVASLIGVFVVYNLYTAVNQNIDHSGYLQKKAIVAEIVADSKSHGYPCVSMSYMTDPGRDLGYRYLFWRASLHVNQPISGSPVYTIVFPHTRANRLDATFGSLGLVYPDYSRYTQTEVTRSCSGANSNLTDPMFGFNR